MTVDEAIKAVEAAGWFWALERDPTGYTGVVARKNLYLGDDLCGPGAKSGNTPAEALMNAMKHETEYEAEQAARQS